MKTITLVAHRRPEYLRQVIESLRANDTRGYSLIAVQDYCVEVQDHLDSVWDCIDAIDFMPKHVLALQLIDPNGYRPLGVNLANKRAYEIALEFGSTMNVAIEDDTPLAPDCLDMVNWWDKKLSGWKRERILTCFSNDREPKDPGAIARGEFCPWVWAANKMALETLLANWMCNPDGWDWSCIDTCKKHDILVNAPRLSRSANIGRDGGVHYTHALFDDHFKGHVMSDGTCKDYHFV